MPLRNRTAPPDLGEIMAGGGDKKKSYTAIAETTNIPIVSRPVLDLADVPEETIGANVSVIQGSGLEP
jgi:type IV secretion system protein VirD4